ncbi:hypothetical protein JD969_05395 [Planctomycetota bacterium]|nr:hypothetical protein JD969_05395 [Planctomycetota bacterium]
MQTKRSFILSCLPIICLLFTGAAQLSAATSSTYTWKPRKVKSDELAIAQEHRYAEKVNKTVKTNLIRYETTFFELYTDIPKEQAIKWQIKLDPIYRRLIALLDLPANCNIWQGKASIYLFDKKADFIKFEDKFYGNKISFEAALCHQHYTGEVRLALYEMDDSLFLRQLFIHEMMHGIVHRYQTPKRIPTWLNEGIAEWAANQLLGDAPTFRMKQKLSRKFLHNTQYLPADFFSDYRFKPEFYGTAFSLTKMLTTTDKTKFIKFLSTVKQYTPWQKALKNAYKMTPEQLIATYASNIGLNELPIEIPTITTKTTLNNKTPQAASSP